ncbi:MAG: ATP-binding protein [Bacteroidales bacterium]|nr:ATP-binding protein [Bacteroidales bacterium]
MKFRTIEDLQSLIDNEIEESTELEYKSSFATENQKWKNELAKDVSAMANANGGTIVYGIREKEGNNGHAIPNELLPIQYDIMSKDRLSLLLSSSIQPKIENIKINTISFDDRSGFFVIEIPQSDTAHQNKLTHLYYKRSNATVLEMEDYEIRDVMNRTKHPIVELEFELHKTILHITEKQLPLLNYNGRKENTYSTKTVFDLKYRLINKGRVFAKYINYFIHIPLELLHDEEKDYVDVDGANNCFDVIGDNTVRDITAVKGLSKEYGPARYDPLLPNVKGRRKSVELNCCNVDDLLTLPPLWYSVLADNAPERRIIVEWKDIKVVEKDKSVTKDPFSIPQIY